MHDDQERRADRLVKADDMSRRYADDRVMACVYAIALQKVRSAM